ncbi:MAG: hypothetical protein KAR42_18110, partial [candidate division Zixibacteria bacterium]|nr:hypothetical protein [candidate division Zixibacteria bacterium]
PHGLEFKIPVFITMPYNMEIVTPYNVSELYTWFYNEKEGHWKRLERVSVDKKSGEITSITTHFSDYIASTLKLPESPDPLSFNPNSIKDIEAGDPANGIPGLDGLKPGPFGNANFNLPFRLPPGRAGMAPVLSLDYSSGGGNSWVGRGFNLPVPEIRIDTRFGLPVYNNPVNNRTDSYLLNGAELIYTGDTIDGSVFIPRVERDFKRILRKGNNALNYFWEVTDKSGTVWLYGNTGESRSGAGAGIFIWHLSGITDRNGNTIEYHYKKEENYTYLDNIIYTGHTIGETGHYRVDFITGNDRRDRLSDCSGGYISKLSLRLERVDVYYDNSLIRSYDFEYDDETGPGNIFGHSRLLKFSELDSSENEFYAYNFDYFDIPDVPGGYDGFNDTVSWGNADSGPLSSSRTLGGGGGLYAGIGISPIIGGAGNAIKTCSFGLDLGFQAEQTVGKDMFLDITGDGLPDQITRSGGIRGDIIFRENTGSGFAGPVVLPGFTGFINEGKQRSFSFGISGGISILRGSLGKTYTWSHSSSALSDVNGDGYVDIIPDEKCNYYYRNTGGSNFERINWMDMGASSVTPEPDPQIEELKKVFHLTDPVRRWNAYKSGTIVVTGMVINIEGGERSFDGMNPSDGIKANFYHNNDNVWSGINNPGTWNNVPEEERSVSALLMPGDYYMHNNTFTVENGDDLYFRVSSIKGMEDDVTEWDPEIKYESIVIHEDMALFDCAYLPHILSPGRYREMRDRARTINESVWNEINGLYTRNTSNQGQLINYTLKINSTIESLDGTDRDKANRIRTVLVRAGYVVPRQIPVVSYEDDILAYINENYSQEIPYEDPVTNEIIFPEENNPEHVFWKQTAYYWDADRCAYILNMSGSNRDKILFFLMETLNEDWDKSFTNYMYTGRHVPVQKASDESYYVNLNDQRRDILCDILEDEEVPVLGAHTQKGVLMEITRDEYNEIIRLRWINDDGTNVVLITEEDGIETVLTAGVSPDLNVEKDEESIHVYFKDEHYTKTFHLRYSEDVPERVYAPVYLKLYEEALGLSILKNNFENNILPLLTAEDQSFLNGCYVFVPYEPIPEPPEVPDGEYVPVVGLTIEDMVRVLGLLIDTDYLRSWYTLNSNYFILGELPEEEEELEAAKDEIMLLILEKAGISLFNRLSRNFTAGESSEYDVDSGILPEGVKEDTVISTRLENSGPESSFVRLEDYRNDGSTVIKREYVHVFKALPDFNIRDLVRTGDVSGYDEMLDEDWTTESGLPQFTSDEPFSGGVYGWYYGEVNGFFTDWDEERLGTQDYIDELDIVYSLPMAFRDENAYTELTPEMEELFGGNAAFFNVDIWHGAESTYSDKGYDRDTGDPYERQYYFTSYITGSEMGPSRKGGDTIDKVPVPGIVPGAGIGGIRNSKGDSKNWNAGLLGLSVSGGEGGSHSEREFMDVNKDRYPDQIICRNGSIRIYPGVDGDGFGDSYTMNGMSGYLRESKNNSFGFGLSPGPGASVIKNIIDSRGESDGVEPSEASPVGIGISGTFGRSRTTTDLIDINGDGLPDHLFRDSSNDTTGYQVRLNTGSNFTSVPQWTVDGPSGYAPDPYDSLGRLTGNKHAIRYSSNLSLGSSVSLGLYGIGVNAYFGTSGNATRLDLIDMNGDGLKDQVYKSEEGNFFTVRFNYGDCFGPAVKWYVPANWEIDNDGFNLGSYMEDQAEEIVEDAVSGMGDNKGANADLDFGNIQSSDNVPGSIGDNIAGVPDVISYSGGFNLTIGINYTPEITIIPPLPFFPPGIGIYITPRASFHYKNSSARLELRDINGDGLPDHIFKDSTENFSRVKLNNAGKSGLLCEVRTPGGGIINIDYEKTPNTKDLPNSRWVMSSVLVNDGMDAVGEDTDTYENRYNYTGGYYSRTNRQFYGFAIIETVSPDESISRSYYNNREYWSHGLLVQSEKEDSAGRLYELLMNEYIPVYEHIPSGPGDRESVFPQLISERQRSYDPVSGEYTESETQYTIYDAYGNVMRILDLGDTTRDNDNIVINILYRYYPQRYLMGLPEEIAVWDYEGELVRMRRGIYDERGNLIEHSAYLRESDEYASTSISYNMYGNLTEITYPGGYNVNYDYDLNVQTYILRITDSFDYTSTAAYDYRFGVPVESTDISSNTMIWEYDNFGRLEKVWSPYDDPDDISALSFEYYEHEFPQRAVTFNKLSFDSENDDVLTTVTLKDGLGRVIQVKKDGEVYDTELENTVTGMNVSGLIEYDNMGRVQNKHQTWFEPGEVLEFTGSGPEKNPTLTYYDTIGRVTQKILPDESEINIRYSVVSGQTESEVTDPEGKVSREYR